MRQKNIIGRGQRDENIFFVPVDVIESVEQRHEIDDPAENIELEKYFWKMGKQAPGKNKQNKQAWQEVSPVERGFGQCNK